MRPLSLAILTLCILLALGCRKQRSSDTGGMSDTTPPAATAAPAPIPADTSSGPGDFGFDRRQEFAQSVRQQLTSLDRQISELATQAKSRGGAVSDRALANVRTARRSVDRNLKSVEGATAANWDQLKQRVTSGLDNLSEAIEAAQPK
jgi:hypothetical protein